jgi:hypothetical protein
MDFRVLVTRSLDSETVQHVARAIRRTVVDHDHFDALEKIAGVEDAESLERGVNEMLLVVDRNED